MIRTIVASRSSSRIYTRRIIRLSVTKRHGCKSNRLYFTARRPLALGKEILILSSSSSARIYTDRRIIRPDELSTVVGLSRRTTVIVRLDV